MYSQSIVTETIEQLLQYTLYLETLHTDVQGLTKTSDTGANQLHTRSKIAKTKKRLSE